MNYFSPCFAASTSTPSFLSGALLPVQIGSTTRLCSATKRRRTSPPRLCSETPPSNRVSNPSTSADSLRQSLSTPSSRNGAAPNRANGNGVGESRGGDADVLASAGEDTKSQSGAEAGKKSGIAVSFGPISTTIPARWLLYAVPFFWGSFGPAVRLLFSQDPHPGPSVFNSERLLLSTLVYVPVLVGEVAIFRKRNTTAAEPGKSFAFVPAGVELGIYVFLANVAQVIGLQQTSASRAAFLVQLQTVIVPVLAGLFGLDKISRKTWISSLVAVAGVALLSSDKSHGSVSSLYGDSLEVLSALFFSTYIIRLANYCNKVPANPLVATKIVVQAVLSIAWAASVGVGSFVHHAAPTDLSKADDPIPWTVAAALVNVGVVVWTGLFSSAAAGWAQTRGQQDVPASQAVVIFATQPLWASALAALVLGESFGPKGFGGGAMIVAATLLAAGGGGGEDKGEKEGEKEGVKEG